jgi:dienelactone hydrolase
MSTHRSSSFPAKIASIRPHPASAAGTGRLAGPRRFQYPVHGVASGLRAVTGMLFLGAVVAGMQGPRGIAAEAVLAGTRPLTLDQPLDEIMVDGIDRFALREIAASPSRRDAAWQRDFTSEAAYRSSVAAQREKFREYIGAVDPRLPAGDFELLGTIHRDAKVGESDDFNVFAVRWPVLDGLTGEGLLLQPKGAPQGRVVVLPDADWTPEMFVGLAAGVDPQAQLPRRLAAQGWQVLVPMLISRDTGLSGNPDVKVTKQPQREFIYRPAFEMGRHVIGYEVQKVLAAIDIFTAANQHDRTTAPLAVAGVGEGGLLALYAAALDERIERTLVCGYFQSREGIWEEPIYRNVWGLLTLFGDAELAGLIAPRMLVIEACAVPEVNVPLSPRTVRRPAITPGRIATAPLPSVKTEYERARRIFERLGRRNRLQLIANGTGDGPAGTAGAMTALVGAKPDGMRDSTGVTEIAPPFGYAAPNEPRARERRQFREMQAHVGNLVRLSGKVRDAKWSRIDRSSVEKWNAQVEPLRDWVYDELIGPLPKPNVPLNPRTRRVPNAPWLAGHAGAFDAYEVVLDVYEDVIAAGVLLLPTGLRPGEKRPVVVCQHGLEGLAQDTVGGPGTIGYRFYNAFSAELCKRGFIVYAPQNPYRGGDTFRTVQRKSNVLKRSLFSYIIPQHERTLEWLGSLPWVDSARIAFYGLSYGGKTAMRVPPLVKQYCLSICSGDFNDWIKKNTTHEHGTSYVFSQEYEIFEWNMGHVANYAELAYLMMPRPFMVERGHNDGVALDEWVAWEYAKVRRHYDQLGIGDRTEIEFFNGPHTIHGQGTFRFLHRHLNWPENVPSARRESAP